MTTTAFPLMTPLQLMDPSPLTFQLHFPLNQNANLNLLKKIRNPRRKNRASKPKTSKLKTSKPKTSKPKISLDSAIKSYLKKSKDIQEKRLNMTRNIPKPQFILQQTKLNRMQSNQAPTQVIHEAVQEAFAQTLADERRAGSRRNEDREARGEKRRGRPTGSRSRTVTSGQTMTSPPPGFPSLLQRFARSGSSSRSEGERSGGVVSRRATPRKMFASDGSGEEESKG